MKSSVAVVGAGLSGVEASVQLARRGFEVTLFEMRPGRPTPAHQTEYFSELVCSNSLGSELTTSAKGLLKAELDILDSFILEHARKHRVPAGRSLAVDRHRMARSITRAVEAFPGIQVVRQEVPDLEGIKIPAILATGPLTSDSMADSLTRLTRRRNLFFFDATSPLIRNSSIDRRHCFSASRYEKGEADFINIPLDAHQYNLLVDDLVSAEKVPVPDFEKRLFFDSCLPVEEIARRGRKALAFGPLKPVGLVDPATGGRPHAVIQLRRDDLKENLLQMVGFQTRLKWPEQKRVFQKIPALQNAVFERYGRMHRNTYLNAPLILNSFLQARNREDLFFAGQLSGSEGYVEAIATGLMAALNLARMLRNQPLTSPPGECALGSLAHYLSHAAWEDFRPTRFTFGLLPPMKGKKIPKRDRKLQKAQRALEKVSQWKESLNI